MDISSLKESFWIFTNQSQQRKISIQEEIEAKSLPIKRSNQYKYSRGNMRYALSKLFNIDPLKIPLHSLPGYAPILNKGFGYVSMSHCHNALLIGWSKNKLGVDIENIYKNPMNKKIAKRF